MVSVLSRNGARPGGFTMPGKRVKLEFDESTDYAGAIVYCRGKLPLRDALILQRSGRILARVFNDDSGEDVSDEEITQAQAAVQRFGEVVLIDWNLVEPRTDDEGEPVLDADGNPILDPIPPTPEAFAAQPTDFILACVVNWSTATQGVSRPLAQPLASGEPSEGPDDLMGL